MSTTDIYPLLKNIKTILKYFNIEYKDKGNFSCPFHEDKNPSCNIYSSQGKEYLHCFSCGYHYDALEFYKEYKQVSHAKALEDLSVIYGFKIKKKEAVRNEEENAYCFDLDAEGREYLKSRGICAAYELLDIRSGRRDNSSCLVYAMINGAYRYKALDNNAVKDRTLKGVNSDISVYAGTEGGPYFVVEGLFDMLTLMELDSSLNVISLNGVGNREKAVKYIQENSIYRVVLALDNDKAGKGYGG